MRTFAPLIEFAPSDFLMPRGPIAPAEKPHDHKWSSLIWSAMRHEKDNSLHDRARSERVFIKRGFSRTEAATYIGVSPTKFDQLVLDGRMPKPMQIDGRRVWDVRELDPAFEELGSVDSSWDDFQ